MTTPADLLLEVRTEPVVGMLRLEAARDLEAALLECLAERGVVVHQSELIATPYRVAVLAQLGSCDDLVKRVSAVVEQVLASSATSLAPGKCSQIEKPITALLANLDGQSLEIDIHGLRAQPHSVGHVISSPRQFRVSNCEQYRRELASRGIEGRPGEREAGLLTRLQEKAEELGGQLVEDEELLGDLAQSLEITGVLEGSFPELAAQLPREFVQVCLHDKLRGFAIERAGKLLPQFLVSIDRPDDPKGAIRRGYERTFSGHLRAIDRMWKEDKIVPLAERYRELKRSRTTGGRTKALLLSGRDRADRVSRLAEALGSDAGWTAEAGMAGEAARLLKADTSTRLQNEFPSLGGMLSGLLAREEGYPESLWQAIYDHGKPKFPGDTVPRGKIGKIVALADRIDELVIHSAKGGLAVGETSERSRFLATGAIRIILQGRIRLDLDLAAARAVRGFVEDLPRTDEQILADLRPFFDRALRSVLAQDGYRPDEVESVLGSRGGRYLPDVFAKIQIVNRIQGDDVFARLVRSAHRLIEILADSPEFALEAERLVEPAERSLFQCWDSLRGEIDKALQDGREERWLLRMGELNEALEKFWAEVLVRDENESLRQNRLALMQAVHRVFSRQIRLAEIEPVEIA